MDYEASAPSILDRRDTEGSVEKLDQIPKRSTPDHAPARRPFRSRLMRVTSSKVIKPMAASPMQIMTYLEGLGDNQ